MKSQIMSCRYRNTIFFVSTNKVFKENAVQRPIQIVPIVYLKVPAPSNEPLIVNLLGGFAFDRCVSSTKTTEICKRSNHSWLVRCYSLREPIKQCKRTLPAVNPTVSSAVSYQNRSPTLSRRNWSAMRQVSVGPSSRPFGSSASAPVYRSMSSTLLDRTQYMNSSRVFNWYSPIRYAVEVGLSGQQNLII